jgi:hypothetical protein
MSLSPTDLQIIAKYLTGGAALGTSVAGGVALANHLNQLSKERDRQRKLDDDILTVKVRRKPGVEKAAMVTGGLALAGSGISAMAAYAATMKAYRALKKKRMQDLLDRAQVQFAETSEEEAKQANTGRPMSGLDLLASSPLAAMLLLGVGSAGIANAYLNKNYPGVKPARPVKPRKVVLKYVDDEQEKEAAYDPDSGFECLVNLVCAGQKSASDVRDIVSACADGRAQELEESIADLGVDAALDTIKGASRDLTPDEMIMGVGIAVRSPGLADTVKTLAAVEYNDMLPAFSKMAAALDSEELEVVQAIACCWEDMHRGVTKEASKVVAENPALAKDLARVLREQQLLAPEDTEYELDTMGRGGSADNGVDRSDEDDPDEMARAMGEGAAMDDVVDQILGGLVGDEPSNE